MGMWDHARNEPITETNTKDELAALSQIAQHAAATGDRYTAAAAHEAINHELNTLNDLKKKK